MNYFLVKVKSSVINEEGKPQRVSESYLVDAMSWTEAESLITKEMEQFAHDEFEITSIVKSNLSEVIEDNNGEKYFKCKVAFMQMNEETGREKKTSSFVFVKSETIDSAQVCLKNQFRDMTVDWEVVQVIETDIVDVYKYLDIS